MDDGQLVTFTLILLSVIVYLANSLKCYTCSSLHDDRCGITWGYTDEQADEYVEECVGDPVLCRKLEYQSLPNVEKIVTRSCWNASHSWDEPNTVCEDMTDGRVCYCENGDTPCNGTELRRTSVLNVLVIISLIHALRRGIFQSL